MILNQKKKCMKVCFVIRNLMVNCQNNVCSKQMHIQVLCLRDVHLLSEEKEVEKLLFLKFLKSMMKEKLNLQINIKY